MALYSCPRCNGKGFIQGFGHVADGRCFACAGAGKLSASAKSLNDAERAGLEYEAHCKEVEARACTEKQERAIGQIARKLGLSPAALVATANGMIAGYHQPEFTKAAVSKAIGMFASMGASEANRLCYPKRAA